MSAPMPPVDAFPADPRSRPAPLRRASAFRWLPVAVAAAVTAADLPSALAADPVIDTLEHGAVDWTEGKVLATGSGAPNTKLPNVAAIRLAAERAAKLDAYRNVVEALEGVKVTVSETGAARLKQPEVKARVEGMVRRCKVKDTRYYSDGAVEVALECAMAGGLATALAPSGPREAPQKGRSVNHTGLVIDASGVDAEPILVPTVAVSGGKTVLSPQMVSAESLRSQGGVVYVKSLEEAKSNPRVGESPLVLAVARVHPKQGWLLDAADAEKLEGLDLSFLSEGKVVVVMGAEEAQP